MGDPILALKWFCLFVVLGFILMFLYKWALNYRVQYGKVKLRVSKTEVVFLILNAIDWMLAAICMVWTVLAWIVQ